MRDCAETCCRSAEAGTKTHFDSRRAPVAGYRWSTASARGETEVFLLSCLDPTMSEVAHGYMRTRGLAAYYDHLALPGGAHGALKGLRKGWGQAFWEHLDLAVELHHIRRVMVMDHRTCALHAGCTSHCRAMRRLEADIQERHPGLEVELLLLSPQGDVTPVH